MIGKVVHMFTQASFQQFLLMILLGLGALAATSILPPTLAAAADTDASCSLLNETPAQRDARMAWWRNDRFGLFIHWGLYAIPAGEWNEKTEHAEWIRTSAQIPLEEYNKFHGQFNPVKFDADLWARLAKAAGMKYIVITSKHHDGFCLWPSEQTDFDVAGAPFKRDILGELSRACARHGLTFCFYHSIMDWHHPDYLPRRDWEVANRPTDGADMERYIRYMKAQLRELVDRYDPAVLWFDGEWEDTWNHQRGLDLYKYMRTLKPDIIVNNRVDKGRSGMAGLTKEGEFCGDFGTPEQEIPTQGLPGVDWESCMTMNRFWGWNKSDTQWKSTENLVRNLIDIASKGGNFLLNVGPKPDGTLPQQAIKRLEEMGHWMTLYGDSIYGTQASPFANLPWGRCTQKPTGQGTTLYLHVFDWPADGKLLVPGLKNKPTAVSFLASHQNISAEPQDDGLLLTLPSEPINPIASVIVLDIPDTLNIK